MKFTIWILAAGFVVAATPTQAQDPPPVQDSTLVRDSALVRDSTRVEVLTRMNPVTADTIGVPQSLFQREMREARYHRYVIPVLLGTWGGYMAGFATAMMIAPPDGSCRSSNDCLNLAPLVYGAVGFGASLLGGIAGATIRGKDKLRIPAFVLLTHSAAVGSLVLASTITQGDGLAAVATIYLLTIPFITAAVASRVDKAWVRRKYRPRVEPMVSMVFDRPAFGFRITL